MPVAVIDGMVDGVVWLPTNSEGVSVRSGSAPMAGDASPSPRRPGPWCAQEERWTLSSAAWSASSLRCPRRRTPRADFSDTPLWLSLVKAVVIFVYLLISTLIVIWFERRVIGRMQQRPGPNRNGPFGLLQTLADGMKSMLKEDITPARPTR